MSILALDLVILTYNEEKNLEHCLQSVHGLVRNIFVIDSGSTDKTVEIARHYGAQVVTHPFTNQAEQFNWALDNLPIQSEWVLRLDADEYLTPELREEIGQTLPSLSPDVCGLMMKRRMVFLGRWIKYGAYYPIWLLRVFRQGKARSENTEMDEHIVLLEGRIAKLKQDFYDHNRKGLSSWLIKHEAYAARQGRVLLRGQLEKDTGEVEPKFWGNQTERKRWLKHHLYGNVPLFLRAFLFFLYRYIFRLGFLDGVPGLIFHFLHAGWYLFYVDAVIYEGSLNGNMQHTDSEPSKVKALSSIR